MTESKKRKEARVVRNVFGNSVDFAAPATHHDLVDSLKLELDAISSKYYLNHAEKAVELKAAIDDAVKRKENEKIQRCGGLGRTRPYKYGEIRTIFADKLKRFNEQDDCQEESSEESYEVKKTRENGLEEKKIMHLDDVPRKLSRFDYERADPFNMPEIWLDIKSAIDPEFWVDDFDEEERKETMQKATKSCNTAEGDENSEKFANSALKMTRSG